MIRLRPKYTLLRLGRVLFSNYRQLRWVSWLFVTTRVSTDLSAMKLSTSANCVSVSPTLTSFTTYIAFHYNMER